MGPGAAVPCEHWGSLQDTPEMQQPRAWGCWGDVGAGVAVAGADPWSPRAEDGAVVMEVDHDKQVVYTETLALALHEPDLLLAAMQPSEEHVAGRLTSPIVSTHLDTRNIAFERWGDGGALAG